MYSRIFVPAYAGTLRGVDKGRTPLRAGCLRGVTLISVVALIFTGLNKGGLDCAPRVHTSTTYRALTTCSPSVAVARCLAWVGVDRVV